MAPKLDDLDDEVAEGIRLWRSYVEQKHEVCGLWVHSPPRGGSSFAAVAAARSLGALDTFKGGTFFTMQAYGAYEDLRSLWDSSKDRSDAPSFAEWASLDAEIHNNWHRSILLLDDLDKTVPNDFIWKHFYPKIRERVKAGMPTIIASRWSPTEIAGDEAQFFYDLFVVVAVHHARR